MLALINMRTNAPWVFALFGTILCNPWRWLWVKILIYISSLSDTQPNYHAMIKVPHIPFILHSDAKFEL